MNRPMLLGLGLLLCTGCVKASDLEERLQPLEQKAVVLQNEQQELQLRVGSNEQRTESLQNQLDALPGQPHMAPVKLASSRAADHRTSAQAPGAAKTPEQTKAQPPAKEPVKTAPAASPVASALEAAKSAPPQTASSSAPTATAPTATAPTATAPTATAARGTPPAPTSGGTTPAPGVTQTPGTSGTPAPVSPAVQPSGADKAAPLATGTLRVGSGASANDEAPVSRANAKGENPTYQGALKMYERGRYTEAEAQFDAFIRDYPQSKLLPNALYWKAECQYSRGNYADSIFVFKDVTARFSKHSKAPDALFKIALAYKQLGDMDNARLHFRVLGEDYPNSALLKRGKALGLQ